LILAFDLGEAAPTVGRAVQGPHEELAETLLQMLERRRLAATWAVADPAASDFSRRLLAKSTGHEVALRADRTWAGPDVGRMRLSNEFGQRLTRAQAIGCAVSGLSVSGVRFEQNLDVLVKHGISSLVTTGSERASTAGRQERTRRVIGRAINLRFGLWELEPTVRFPSRGDWLWRGAGMQPPEPQSLFWPGLPLNLVAVDIPGLIAKGPRGLRLMERVFRTAAEQRDAGQQAVVTASVLTRQLSRPRALPAARSILRPLAA
jgi:hypothetical protein